MKLLSKVVILSAILWTAAVPSYSKISGNISKGHFFDTEKTIMTDLSQDTSLKTGKYWEKNVFYSNKYRPLFMLSNKELYDLMPKEKVSVVQRITTPSVYNISLKTASIKTVALAQITDIKPIKKPKNEVKETLPENDENLISLYEQAKNPNAEVESKIDTAIQLKDSKNQNYYKLALDLLNDVTKKEPYNAYAYYLKGELYAKQNSPQSAMINYVEALKLNPTSKQCCLGIAKVLEPTNKELSQKYYDMAKN